MPDNNFEELRKFSVQLAVPSIITFILNITGLTDFGLIISVIIHIIVLGVFFMLFKRVRSVLLKLILGGLVTCLLGEILIFFNLEHVKYSNVYWAFIAINFLRHLIFSVAFGWNAFKSHKYNSLLIKLLPFISSVPIFFLLHVFVFNHEDEHKIIYLIYNISVCLMGLTCGLRYNHTSDRSFVVMIFAMISHTLSEIFYFWEFLPDEVDRVIAAFRAPFLQIGSCLTVYATIDHVIHFKSVVAQKILLPLIDRKKSSLSVTKNKIGRSTTKALTPLSKKTLPVEEPLL